MEEPRKEKPTRLLYLVPVFMGLLGGVLMYIAVKDQNQEMANNGMFWSVISTIGFVFLYAWISYLGLLNLSQLGIL